MFLSLVRFVLRAAIVFCALVGVGEVVHSVAQRSPTPGLQAFGGDVRVVYKAGSKRLSSALTSDGHSGR